MQETQGETQERADEQRRDAQAEGRREAETPSADPSAALTETGFPADFAWGVATSAYQIEGAAREDGKGESIWDRFSHTPGAIKDGSDGDIADDHYHRWNDDLDLLARMSLNAYRFSISWPRIQPEGHGRPNPAGLDFYERLVDGLHARGVAPYATLFHWDLPQALQDRGGWANRDTAAYFADYAQLLAQRLGDRVAGWITHNEPSVVAYLGHVSGEHAPGLRDRALYAPVTHHLLLSHGLATQAIRAYAPEGARVGVTLNISAYQPNSNREPDRLATETIDGIMTRWYLDPLFRGEYPQDVQPLLPAPAGLIHAGDLELIRQPLDFLGLNYYTRSIIAAGRTGPTDPQPLPPRGSLTQMGWEVYPQGLYDVLMRVHRDYFPGPLYITENGAAYADTPDATGAIHDPKRTEYLRAHLLQTRRALADGAPIRGYFAWSLLDNFEWAEGYRPRFGIVGVDYRTQERRIKDSGAFYARVAATNGGALESDE